MRQALEKIKQRLTRLAAQQELFTPEDFPSPEPGSKRASCLYRLSGDPDHRFAHMYGLALEQLRTREHYKAEERAWKLFPPHSDIREARG